MRHSGKDGSAVGRAAREKLATTLETVFSEAVYDHSALRNDVCGYVRELKLSGMTPQNAVIAVRKLVRESASGFPDSERGEKLLSTMLGWCLDEYYRETA